MLRIVGGHHRGRKLAAPEGRDVRPTSERTREALFNLLAHRDLHGNGRPVLRDARVLDLFCGTGALGLEALSRGAGFATFLDKDERSLKVARQNIRACREEAKTEIVAADAAALAGRARPRGAPFDLVVMDPPYRSDAGDAALAALAQSGWLAPSAVIGVEVHKRTDLTLPEGYTILDERRYGIAKIVLLRWEGAS